MHDDTPPAALAAAARTTFQLTYARSPRPRQFSPAQLTGPDIPCAYGGDLDASGDWLDGRDDADELPARTEADWIDRYANYAINEAVHEALEWLRVDGCPWLDPHGPAEAEVYAAVNELVDRLAAIRNQH